ncbi:MAG: hypothetical protein NTY37_06115 [Methanothrix sp.]|nr:hypothetical protein [Methanothrix sp.]
MPRLTAFISGMVQKTGYRANVVILANAFGLHLIDVQSIENEYTASTGEFTGFEKMVTGGETDQRLDKAADLLKDLIVVSKEIVVELKATHEDIKGVRDEVKGAREDIRGVHEAVQNVCQAVNNR